MIDVVPVSGRAALRDFIDFPYRKNTAVIRLGAAAAARRARAFQPKKSVLRARGHPAVPGPKDNRTSDGSPPSMIALTRRFIMTILSPSSWRPTMRDCEGAAAGGRARARARGQPRVRGPLNPSLNDTAGSAGGRLRQRADAVDAMANPPEYAGYITGAGYAKGERPLRVDLRLQSSARRAGR